jgi:hypothetical protein
MNWRKFESGGSTAKGHHVEKYGWLNQIDRDQSAVMGQWHALVVDCRD